MGKRPGRQSSTEQLGGVLGGHRLGVLALRKSVAAVRVVAGEGPAFGLAEFNQFGKIRVLQPCTATHSVAPSLGRVRVGRLLPGQHEE